MAEKERGKDELLTEVRRYVAIEKMRTKRISHAMDVDAVTKTSKTSSTTGSSGKSTWPWMHACTRHEDTETHERCEDFWTSTRDPWSNWEPAQEEWESWEVDWVGEGKRKRKRENGQYLQWKLLLMWEMGKLSKELHSGGTNDLTELVTIVGLMGTQQNSAQTR